MQKLSERGYVFISVEKLLKNIDFLKKISNFRRFFAVVKANAYGHGEIAKRIESHVDGFAVATFDEAYALRKTGVKKPVLILGYVPEDKLLLCYAYSFSLCGLNKEYMACLSRFAVKLGVTLSVHLKIDTGMTRTGVSYKRIDELPDLRAYENLRFEGIFSHFCVADSDENFTRTQIRRFAEIVEKYEKDGINFEYVHIAASSGITGGYFYGNAVRAGYALYGYGASENLSPAMKVVGRVIAVNEVEPKQGVGYGLTYKPPKKTRVAVVSVGYGDGYPRNGAKKKLAIYKGEFLRVVGRVCMDALFLDCGEKEVTPGDYVTLLGEDGDKKISPDDLGFGYKVLCDFALRLTRVIV